jgi:hypothetical protein
MSGTVRSSVRVACLGVLDGQFVVYRHCVGAFYAERVGVEISMSSLPGPS